MIKQEKKATGLLKKGVLKILDIRCPFCYPIWLRIELHSDYYCTRCHRELNREDLIRLGYTKAKRGEK